MDQDLEDFYKALTQKAVNRKDRECQVALRSHRPRSPLRDPKRPAHACWRLGEPALHPLTDAGRPHAHAMPQSCTRASTHHQIERTHLHNTLHTAWLHACTRGQWEQLSSSSSSSSSDGSDDDDDNNSDGRSNNTNNTPHINTSHHHITTQQHLAHGMHAHEGGRSISRESGSSSDSSGSGDDSDADGSSSRDSSSSNMPHITQLSTTHCSCSRPASFVHVLTLLGGRAPTPQGYIKRDQNPGHCRKACPLQSLQPLPSEIMTSLVL